MDTERTDAQEEARERSLTEEIEALQAKLKKHHSELDQLRVAREERERRVRERSDDPEE